MIFLAQRVTINISPRLLFYLTKQPAAGAPGYITTSLLNGMSFVEGWESRFFISKWCMQQLVCFYILAFFLKPIRQQSCRLYIKKKKPRLGTTQQQDLERCSNNTTKPTKTTNKTTKTTSNKGGLDSTPCVCSCGHHNFCHFRKNPEKVFLLQLLECPSIYELLANPNYKWKDTPLLQIWRENLDNDGKKSALLESYEPEEAIKMIEKALSSNEVCHSHFKLLGNSAYPNAHSF